MVITGVADRLADRIQHIVYLDAVLPNDGEKCCGGDGGVDRNDFGRCLDSYVTCDAIWHTGRGCSTDGVCGSLVNATSIAYLKRSDRAAERRAKPAGAREFPKGN